MNKRAFLTFRVGEQYYGVDIIAVFEVANLVAINHIPDMPPSILGVVNIRGHVVPVLDLRIRFDTPYEDMHLTTPIVFLQTESDVGIYEIVVDDVSDVITLDDDGIRFTALSQRAAHLIGITDYQARMVALLNPVELMLSSLEDRPLEDILELIQEES